MCDGVARPPSVYPRGGVTDRHERPRDGPEFFEAAETATATDGSEGAYWFRDCAERVRDVDHDGEGPAACPSCGAEMAFERSVGASGCAC